MVSVAQEGINRLFYSAHEPTGDKEAFGSTGRRGRALGWQDSVVAVFPLTTSLHSGRGRLGMRKDVVCTGRRKAASH